MNNHTTWGNTPSSIANVLKMAINPDTDPLLSPDDRKRMMLNQILDHRLAHRSLDLDALSPDTPEQQTVKAILTTGTSLDQLKRIKHKAKTIVDQPPSSIDQAVNLAIYYAAILSAWVHQSTWITKLSAHQLRDATQHLADQDWMDADLSRLFHSAQSVLDTPPAK